MLGLVNDLGNIKAIISAIVQLCLMNAFAKRDCLPNGGFPTTMYFRLDGGGDHLRKSAFINPWHFGFMSIPIVSRPKRLKKLPSPAEGSMNV
jgi:hypothetical protein